MFCGSSECQFRISYPLNNYKSSANLLWKQCRLYSVSSFIHVQPHECEPFSWIWKCALAKRGDYTQGPWGVECSWQWGAGSDSKESNKETIGTYINVWSMATELRLWTVNHASYAFVSLKQNSSQLFLRCLKSPVPRCPSCSYPPPGARLFTHHRRSLRLRRQPCCAGASVQTWSRPCFGPRSENLHPGRWFGGSAVGWGLEVGGPKVRRACHGGPKVRMVRRCGTGWRCARSVQVCTSCGMVLEQVTKAWREWTAGASKTTIIVLTPVTSWPIDTMIVACISCWTLTLSSL